MKKLLLPLLIIPSFAFAQEKFECVKVKKGEVKCSKTVEASLDAKLLLQERQKLENGVVYLQSQIAEAQAKIAELNEAIESLKE